jgi:hypothetical protein
MSTFSRCSARAVDSRGALGRFPAIEAIATLRARSVLEVGLGAGRITRCRSAWSASLQCSRSHADTWHRAAAFSCSSMSQGRCPSHRRGPRRWQQRARPAEPLSSRNSMPGSTANMALRSEPSALIMLCRASRARPRASVRHVFQRAPASGGKPSQRGSNSLGCALRANARRLTQLV